MAGAHIIRREDLEDLRELSLVLKESHYFQDAATQYQASVKVLAGRELGLGPVASMMGLHIVKGKVELSANLIAAKLKEHPTYDYKVVTLERDECSIDFFENGELLGNSTFNEQDRADAGLGLNKSGVLDPDSPWRKHRRNMFFARALSNGAKWFCPDVFYGIPVYADGELEPEAQMTEEQSQAYFNPDEDDVVEGEIIDEGSEQSQAAPRDATSETTSEGPAADPSTSDEAVPAADAEEPSGRRMATDKQLQKLAILAGEFGWDDEERRRRAGVSSFKELTFMQASTLIEAWGAESGQSREVAESADAAAVDSARAGSAAPPPDVDDPATEEHKARAVAVFKDKGKLLTAARKKWGKDAPRSLDAFTKRQLGELLEEALVDA